LDESALTGESLPVAKADTVLAPETVLADRANMLFSGTLVTAGRGIGVVVATGADTELGLMHRLLGETSELTTPLTRKLGRFSRILTVVILALAGVTFAVGIARGESAPDMLVAAVALAVGAIPEALPAAVTVSLAIGVGRMARRNAVIRRLPAVETLGSTTVICTDKTGTLTQNAMTVQTVLAGGERYDVGGGGYAPEGELVSSGRAVSLADHPALAACLRAGVLCGNADVRARDGVWEPVGDPMEAALVVSARKAGIGRSSELRNGSGSMSSRSSLSAGTWPRCTALPAGTRELYIKGAPEHVLPMCEQALGRDGHVEPLHPAGLQRSSRAEQRRLPRSVADRVDSEGDPRTGGAAWEWLVRVRGIGWRPRPCDGEMCALRQRRCPGSSVLTCTRSAVRNAGAAQRATAIVGVAAESRVRARSATVRSSRNIARPTRAPDRMYHGHGPMTLNSELWTGR
jgi:cation-transporting ATPase F